MDLISRVSSTVKPYALIPLVFLHPTPFHSCRCFPSVGPHCLLTCGPASHLLGSLFSSPVSRVIFLKHTSNHQIPNQKTCNCFLLPIKLNPKSAFNGPSLPL